MIEVSRMVTPKSFWRDCSYIVRSNKEKSILDIADILRNWCETIETLDNIDSDYLMMVYAIPCLNIYSFHSFIRG